METMLAGGQPFLWWLGRASWQAAVLVLLVLTAQGVFRKQLRPRWRYALWLLVVVRLALPVSWSSGWSIFNWASWQRPLEKAWSVAEYEQRFNENAVARTINPPIPRKDFSADPVPARSAASSPVKEIAVPEPFWFHAYQGLKAGVARESHWLGLLPFIWLAGALALAVQVLGAARRLASKIDAQKPVAEETVLELLEECRRSMGVSVKLILLETREVSSPALYGFFRPRLLLPDGLIRNFNAQELRYVFLHELAHVKRRDIAMNWVMAALQILHWFNPLVWVAFHRMRADRELACDALALSYASEGEHQGYGQTIIKLLEGYQRTTSLPGLVGILEDQNLMKRRIAMIAGFKRSSRWSVFAATLVLGLALVSLTDAKSSSTVDSGVKVGRTTAVEKKTVILASAQTNEGATIAAAKITGKKVSLTGGISVKESPGAESVPTPSSTEPIYQGRRLTEWLDDFGNRRRKMGEAEEAFHHFGTNAIPFLVREIRDPGWRVIPVVAETGVMQKRFGVQSLERRDETGFGRQIRATWAFSNLGAENRFALLQALAPFLDRPTLTFFVVESMEQIDGQSNYYGSMSPEVLSLIMKTMTNASPDVRASVISAVSHGYNDKAMIPELIARLKDPYAKVRAAAMGALGSFQYLPYRKIIPALMENLQNEDSGVRRDAANAFETFGGFAEAKPAVPLLTKALDDPDASVREAAKKGLAVIKANKD